MGQKYRRGFVFGLQWLALLLLTILSGVEQAQSNDIKLYYDTAVNILNGQLPYRDFDLEYPPFALIPMIIPQLINPGKVIVYGILFWLENLGLVFVIAFTIWKITLSWYTKSQSQAILRFYFTIAFLLSTVLFWRYDLFPTALTILAFWFVLNNFPLLSGICLGLGITAKLYPVVFFPIYFLYYLTQKQFKNCGKFLLGFSGSIAVSVLPFIFLDAEKFWSFLQYHQGRGLQLESLASGLILLASKLNFTQTEIIFNYGAFHVESSLANSLLKSSLLTYLFISLSIILAIYCYYYFHFQQVKYQKISDLSLMIFLILALLIMMLINKVFSPQYMIWLLPLAVLLPKRDRFFYGLICLLTTLIYPILYGTLIEQWLLGIVLLNIRNGLLVLFVIRLLQQLKLEFNQSVKANLE